VVDAFTSNNVMVILDNHVSAAGLCCTESDGNGLWFNENYTTEDFISSWELLVDMFKGLLS
jgi:endoglucanase